MAFVYTETTGTSQTMANDTVYIANNASVITFSLPATSAVGNTVGCVGKGAGGWKIQLSGTQVIRYIDTSTVALGSLQNFNQYACVELVCVVANTEWVVRSSMGNMTIT